MASTATAPVTGSTSEPLPSRSAVWYGAALLTLFAFQAWHLDSDPSPLKRMGDFSDEGYWQHNARCHALFGTWLPDEFNQALIGAPLFTALQRLFFCLGVNLFTARLMPLLAFWLILLMLFDVLRRELSAGQALAIVFALGLMHEMLMYAKWSTPLLPETACHVAVLYFVCVAARRGTGWLFAAGLGAASAFAMKLSAFNSALGVLLFVVASALLRRDVERRGLFVFAAGWLAGMAALAAFLLLNFKQFQFLQHTIGSAYVGHKHSLFNVPLEIALFPVNQLFSHPGAAIAVMLTTLWACGQAAAAQRHGITAMLKEMSRTEFFCLCWLAGAALVIGLSPEKSDRRYVALLVPLVVLAGSFACRAWTAAEVSRTGTVTKLAFFVVCGLCWSALLRNTVDIVTLVGFDHNLRGQRLIIWAACSMAGLLLAALYHLAGRERLLARTAVIAFFAIALVLDGIWYGNATWTLRETSQDLGQWTSPKEYALGSFCHELALENKTLPLWSPLSETMPMNLWFEDQVAAAQFVEIVDDAPADGSPELLPTPLGHGLHLNPDRVVPVKRFAVCPSALTGRFRLQGEFYRWRPDAAESSRSAGEKHARIP